MDADTPGPVRSFVRSFTFAGQGVWHAVRTQRNMRVHVAAAVVVLVAGGIAGIGAGDWAALALAIGLVLTAEIFNTVIEAIIDLQTPEFHPLAKIAKDGAAGAVLVASLAAIGVAIAVFVPHL
jgi:diacylglycerol kinase